MIPFLALRKTHLISNISPPARRGMVLLEFVNSIMAGIFPTMAIDLATHTFKLENSILFPIDRFNVEKDGKVSRKKIKKNFKNNFSPENKKPPKKRPCRNCNMLLFSHEFTRHNRVCPRVRN